MTVEDFFDQFLVNDINLNKVCEGECDGSNKNCDICLVTSTYKALVENLKKSLKILPTKDEENLPSYFLTGSYRRQTMIRPPKDVDLFIVLDNGEYQDNELHDLITPKVLIARLKATLETIFKNNFSVKVKEQRHSVTVIYNENFSIDVIPAFETDDKKAYKIPDTETGNNGRYITSNPKLHYEYINKVNDNTASGGKKRFKKIARLIKFVKRNEFNDEPKKVRSFHFELLAAEILGKSEINSYSQGLYQFFALASDYFDESVIEDPANSSNKVDDYLANKSIETKELIKDELNSLSFIARRTLELEGQGDHDGAIKEWKKIFSTEEKPVENIPLVEISRPPQPWCKL